jgi:histone acetyltransferase
MKVAYPAGSNRENLSQAQLCLKIARHSPCSVCSDCSGLHPAEGVRVVLDVTEEEEDDTWNLFNDSDDEDAGPASSYLETCACGHDAKTHNADERVIGKTEFYRRSNVGIRIDEVLKVCSIYTSWMSDVCSDGLTTGIYCRIWLRIRFLNL